MKADKIEREISERFSKIVELRQEIKDLNNDLSESIYKSQAFRNRITNKLSKRQYKLFYNPYNEDYILTNMNSFFVSNRFKAKRNKFLDWGQKQGILAFKVFEIPINKYVAKIIFYGDHDDTVSYWIYEYFNQLKKTMK